MRPTCLITWVASVICLSTATAQEVAGTVTAHPGGEPVAEVVVMAITPGEYLQLMLASGRTDPQGRFSMRLPTGGARLYFGGVPRGFVYPEPQIVAKIDVTAEDKDLQKLRLEVPRAQ